MSRIGSVIIRIWNCFDRSCTRFDQWWAKLRYWQKGVVVGAGLHVLVAIFIMLLAIIVYLIQPQHSGDFDLTKRHIAETLGVIVLIIFSLVGAIPMYIVRLLGFVSTPPIYANPMTHIWDWLLYILYATAIYIIIGAGVGKVIGLLRSENKGIPENGDSR